MVVFFLTARLFFSSFLFLQLSSGSFLSAGPPSEISFKKCRPSRRKEQQSLWQDTEKERTNPAKESSVKTRITSARPAFNFSKDKTRLVWQMFQDPCLLFQGLLLGSVVQASFILSATRLLQRLETRHMSQLLFKDQTILSYSW